MAKYRFSAVERIAVWQAYDGQCFWCGEPLPLKHLTIDHVIPESTADNPDELQRVLEYYRLPATWSINGYQNWVPAHSACNGKKGSHLFASSPAFLLMLSGVIKTAKRCEIAAAKWQKERSRDQVLASLEVAIERKVITHADIRALATRWPDMQFLTGSRPQYAIDDSVSLLPGTSETVLELLRSATSTLDVVSPYVGTAYWGALEAISSLGIRTRVIATYEGALSRQAPSNSSSGSAGDTAVEVRVLEQLYLKQIITDRRTAAVLSGNLTENAWRHNMEMIVQATGEMVDSMVQHFERLWASAIPLNALAAPA